VHRVVATLTHTALASPCGLLGTPRLTPSGETPHRHHQLKLRRCARGTPLAYSPVPLCVFCTGAGAIRVEGTRRAYGLAHVRSFSPIVSWNRPRLRRARAQQRCADRRCSGHTMLSTIEAGGGADRNEELVADQVGPLLARRCPTS
jgi:hypothetical protein